MHFNFSRKLRMQTKELNRPIYCKRKLSFCMHSRIVVTRTHQRSLQHHRPSAMKDCDEGKNAVDEHLRRMGAICGANKKWARSTHTFQWLFRVECSFCASAYQNCKHRIWPACIWSFSMICALHRYALGIAIALKWQRMEQKETINGKRTHECVCERELAAKRVRRDIVSALAVWLSTCQSLTVSLYT